MVKERASAVRMLGIAGQDYLKAIYEMQSERVTPSLLAERLGVSPAAVTKMLKRLGELRLVQYARSQELALTPAGEKVALEIVRHHRLLEAYLQAALGYSWDQVHDEAERLEHVISEEFEERIDRMLGHPTRDPHGDPIPTRDGQVDATESRRLSELETGRSAVIARVDDRDPALLRYLGGLGLYPDTPVEMRARAPFGGPFTVFAGGREIGLGPEAAAQIFVRPVETAAAGGGTGR